jgi:hypothetical protein
MLGKFGKKAAIGRVPVEVGPDLLHVSSQCGAMLQLLQLPCLRQPLADLCVLAIEFQQISGIVLRGNFEEACHNEHIKKPRPRLLLSDVDRITRNLRDRPGSWGRMRVAPE